MTESVLCFDIECATAHNRADPQTDILRMFGCYSYPKDKWYALTKKEDIQKIISEHTYLVGFNCVDYDNIVLKREGLDLDGKIVIDLFKIFKKRASAIKIKAGLMSELLMSYSLDFITRTIGLVDEKDGKMKDFDYSVLNKESWTDDELSYIKAYLQRDLEVTKKLYDWVEDYFSGFKEFLNDNDIYTKKYLTTSTACMSYKSICKALGWKEEYSDNSFMDDEVEFSGAYVSYPSGEEYHGDIKVWDFVSLYPSIMIMCNVFSPSTFGWQGGKLFKTTGTYNDKERGKVENLFYNWYLKRMEYKKNLDSREYNLKIQLNSSYGLLGCSTYKNVYNKTSAGDVTALGRQFILHARKRLRENGYKNVYSDTDSIYFIDTHKDAELLEKVKKQIIDEIKSSVPFPFEHFNLGLDAEASDIFFFKGKEHELKDEFLDVEDIQNKKLNLMKKCYIYITTSGKLVLKGLNPKKKSTSAITRKIFYDYLVPKIIAEKKVRFPRQYFQKLVTELLEKDISLALVRFDVRSTSEYKSETSIQYEIAKKYGSGIHFLIPNNRYGVGKKDKKYCLLSEFQQLRMGLDNLDLTGIWNELEYFIISEREQLSRWF